MKTLAIFLLLAAFALTGATCTTPSGVHVVGDGWVFDKDATDTTITLTPKQYQLEK